MVSISMVLVTYHQPQSENIRRKISKISHKFHSLLFWIVWWNFLPRLSTPSWDSPTMNSDMALRSRVMILLLMYHQKVSNSLTVQHEAYITRLASLHHRHSIISHHHKKKGEYSTIRYLETEIKWERPHSPNSYCCKCSLVFVNL